MATKPYVSAPLAFLVPYEYNVSIRFIAFLRRYHFFVLISHEYSSAMKFVSHN
jgi:hypothetical protein